MKSSRKALLISLFISTLAVQATASLYPRQSQTGTAGGGDSKPTNTAGGGGAGGGGANTSNTESKTSAPPSTTSQSSTTSAPPSNTSNTSAAPANTPPPTQSTPGKSVVIVSDSDVVVTSTDSSSSTSAAPAATSSKPPSSDDNSGLGQGSIIGLSVAGGIAVIGIIAFFVWKFTRKRFADFDDNEAIKWPDLNNHGNGVSDSHPLPVKNTGRAGFDTGSEGSLSRVESANYSTGDFHAGGPDPYAVPPLPHLNPNQPYQDDPIGGTGYYDPYRGPVPGTLEHGPGQGSEWSHPPEAIPMTQLTMAGGRMSPGPHAHAAYGAPSMDHASAYEAGRQSPGPYASYDAGRQSPGPYAAYDAGRQSPGPYAAYGGRAASPGPQAAYANAGRMSPGPQMAYNTGAVSPAPRIQ